MAISSASSSAQSVSQGLFQTLQLQQAQRNADQARQNARSLENEAGVAQRAADRAERNAQTLNQQAQQAQTSSNSAERNLGTVRSLIGAQGQLTQLSQSVKEAVKTLQSPPVVNTQGQVTGTIINVKA